MEDPQYLVKCGRMGCNCSCDLGNSQSFDSTECNRHHDNEADDSTVPSREQQIGG
jgi:hypothetical protein